MDIEATNSVSFEFDHLFLCTDIGAKVADHLVDVGLIEGSSSQHPGQGTANRRFFFQNAKLEFLWIHNPSEAQSKLIQKTRLWERWSNRHSVCPFGIAFRTVGSLNTDKAFPAWEYHPPYLPDNMSILVGNNSDILEEPMLFQTPFVRRSEDQAFNHPIGFKAITRVEVLGPISAPFTPAFQAVLNSQKIKFRTHKNYYIEIGFDGELQGKSLDFRPDIPLVFRW